MNVDEIANRLKPLTRGKNKVDRDQMELLLVATRTVEPTSLLDLLYPPPKTPRQPKSSRPEKPEWLKRMEKAKKNIAWASPKEAVGRLYEIAFDDGVQPPRKRATSFPKAAAELADAIGGERLADVFGSWVSKQMAASTPQ